MAFTAGKNRLQGSAPRRSLRVISAMLASAFTVSACGIYVDRAAAIEACHATRTFFDSVPNPRAGQEIPPLFLPGNSSRIPPLVRREPDFVRPTVQQLVDKIAFIRSRAASSRDRGLQQRADRLRLDRSDTGGLLLIAGSPLTDYCNSKRY